ncbi:hypothetical protein HME01_33090 [Vreelandella aquamarina]|nr:hypothetical protein HME01_33090 [Halomonas meridiana]
MDIGLEDIDACLPQLFIDAHQLAVLLAIQAEYRPVVEIMQIQRAQLNVAFTAQQRHGLLVLIGANEGHRGLIRQADMSRAVLGRQPELNFRASRGIPPVSGQDEALL